jgi:hypothetical protein
VPSSDGEPSSDEEEFVNQAQRAGPERNFTSTSYPNNE